MTGQKGQKGQKSNNKKTEQVPQVNNGGHGGQVESVPGSQCVQGEQTFGILDNNSQINNSQSSFIGNLMQYGQQTPIVPMNNPVNNPNQCAVQHIYTPMGNINGPDNSRQNFIENAQTNLQNTNPISAAAQSNIGQTEAGLYQMIQQIHQTNMTVLSRLSSIESNVSKLQVIEKDISMLRYDVVRLKDENNTMSNKIVDVETACKSMSSMFDKHVQYREKNERDVKKLKLENEELKTQMRLSKENNNKLYDEVQELKARSMQENLLFFGVREERDEQGEMTETVLREFIKREITVASDVKVDDISFDRVHRLGRRRFNSDTKPRPIVAKFEKFKDRETIRKAGINLNKSKRGYSVREHFPLEMENKRKELYPVMRRYQQDPQNRVVLVRDKLFINGKQYIPGTPDRDRGAYNGERVYNRSGGAGMERSRGNNSDQATPRYNTSINHYGPNRYNNRYSVLSGDTTEHFSPNTQSRNKQKARSPLEEMTNKKYRLNSDSESEVEFEHSNIIESNQSRSVDKNTPEIGLSNERTADDTTNIGPKVSTYSEQSMETTDQSAEASDTVIVQ